MKPPQIWHISGHTIFWDYNSKAKGSFHTMRLQKHCSNVKIVFNYLNGIIYSSDFIEYKNREEMLIREAQLDQYNKKT